MKICIAKVFNWIINLCVCVCVYKILYDRTLCLRLKFRYNNFVMMIPDI